MEFAMSTRLTSCIVTCVVWQAACHGEPRSTLPRGRATPYTLSEIEDQKTRAHCKWHDQQLQRDVVPVRYGSPDLLYMHAKQSRFPHSDSIVFGGRPGEASTT